MARKPLAVVGNVNVDLIMGPVAPWPRPGSEILCPDEDLRVGGAAGNVALAWEAMGIPFQIAANVGTDKFGDWLAEGLRSCSARWRRTDGATTLSVGVTHPDGERTFLTTLGHLPHLGWPDVDAMIDWRALRGGDLLLCGTFLTAQLTREYDALFARARQHDVSVALDTGWPLEGWTDAVRAAVLGWVAQSRMILFNEVEVQGLTGEADPLAAARELAGLLREDGTVVVKRGENGALALRQGTLHQVAAPGVEVCDTIGAGDVFNAAFLAATAGEAPLADALAAAVRTASLAVSTSPRRYTAAMEVPA